MKKKWEVTGGWGGGVEAGAGSLLRNVGQVR